jgi:hypothetical protein
MRAKTLNEIIKGSSGWGALSVGHAGIHLGYDYIKKSWPQILTPLQKQIGIFYPALEEHVPDIKLFIPNILKYMNCSIEEVIILNAHKLSSFLMFNWIDSIMEHVEINISNKATVKMHNLLYDISYDIRCCDDFQIAEANIESNELKDDGSKIDAINVYHPIFIKYK